MMLSLYPLCTHLFPQDWACQGDLTMETWFLKTVFPSVMMITLFTHLFHQDWACQGGFQWFSSRPPRGESQIQAIRLDPQLSDEKSKQSDLIHNDQNLKFRQSDFIHFLSINAPITIIWSKIKAFSSQPPIGIGRHSCHCDRNQNDKKHDLRKKSKSFSQWKIKDFQHALLAVCEVLQLCNYQHCDPNLI